MLLFGAWIISNILQAIIGMGANNQTNMEMMANIPIESIQIIMFLLLIMGSIGVLITAFSSGIMIFTLPYIDFLFPTPIKRRHVLILKLIKDYLRYIFYVFFVTLFLLPILLTSFGYIGINLFPSIFISITAISGLVILIANIAHFITLVFSYQNSKLQIIGAIIKIVLVLFPFLTLSSAVYTYISTKDLASTIASLNSFPLMRLIFAPIDWASRLLLSPLIGITSTGWIQLGLIWALAAFTMLILINRKESIYEPSIAPSIKAGKLRESRRNGDYASIRLDNLKAKGVKKAGHWGIRPFGLGASALFWKNIQLQIRSLGFWSLALIYLPIFLGYFFRIIISSITEEVSFLFALLILYANIIHVAILVRQMRLDLRYSDVIKPMPIAGWKVMLAQILSGVTTIFIPVVLFGISLFIMVPQARTPESYASIFFAPFFCYMTLASSIVASVHYPDSKDFTQNFLLNIIGMLFVGLNLLLCMIVSGVFYVVFTQRSFTALVISASFCALMLGIGWTAIAGHTYDKYEPTGN